ncbi:MAG: hypothetical protein OIF57_12365 [Marinobacterium sp.]|nr:hypothetical protein [Marinobacterium sp.]
MYRHWKVSAIAVSIALVLCTPAQSAPAQTSDGNYGYWITSQQESANQLPHALGDYAIIYNSPESDHSKDYEMIIDQPKDSISNHQPAAFRGYPNAYRQSTDIQHSTDQNSTDQQRTDKNSTDKNSSYKQPVHLAEGPETVIHNRFDARRDAEAASHPDYWEIEEVVEEEALYSPDDLQEPFPAE